MSEEKCPKCGAVTHTVCLNLLCDYDTRLQPNKRIAALEAEVERLKAPMVCGHPHACAVVSQDDIGGECVTQYCGACLGIEDERGRSANLRAFWSELCEKVKYTAEGDELIWLVKMARRHGIADWTETGVMVNALEGGEK